MRKFFEIENRGVVSHHVYQSAIWEISEMFYQKLSKEHQQIFTDAAREAGIWFRPHTGQEAEEKARKEKENPQRQQIDNTMRQGGESGGRDILRR